MMANCLEYGDTVTNVSVIQYATITPSHFGMYYVETHY